MTDPRSWADRADGYKAFQAFASERICEEHAKAEAAGDPEQVANAAAKLWMLTVIRDQLGPEPVRKMSVGQMMAYKKPWTRALKFLVSAYRHHPDYRPNWAPTKEDYARPTWTT